MDIITVIFLAHFFCMVFWFRNVYSMNDTSVAEDFLYMGVVEGNVCDL